MTTRIIPVTAVDATAHVYRIASGQIIQAFDQGTDGLLAVTWRPHADGQGFTLANSPAGQVWAEVRDAVIGLGPLAALNTVDLSGCPVIKPASIQVGKLAQGVRYWMPVGDVRPTPSGGDPMHLLAAEVRELREELRLSASVRRGEFR